MSDENSLYERLGGTDAIDAVVDDFYDRVLSDEALKPYFEGIDIDRLRTHQAAFLTMVMGGPNAYDGQEMRAAHAHLDVTDEDFDRVAEHLAATLEFFDVSESDRATVLDAVESYRDDVVTA